MIDDLRTSGDWKIHLKMKINFMSSKDSDEKRLMHSKRNKIETMIGVDTNETIEAIFDLLFLRYQVDLEQSLKGSNFAFDYVEGLHYKCHEISLNRGGSYIHYPERIKDKKETINRRNSDNICFHYAIIAALNHKNVQKNPQRIQYERTKRLPEKQKSDKRLLQSTRQLFSMLCFHQTIGKK